MKCFLCFVVLSAPLCSEAVTEMANPIRKVVTLLTKMQTQVAAEGEKEEKLYKTFMCYCKSSGDTLSASVEAAKNRIAAYETQLPSFGAMKEQAEATLKASQAGRKEAKEAMAAATAIRETEAAVFAKVKADYEANLAALTKALAAIEAGVSGSFLQSSAANRVRKFVMVKAELVDYDREQVLAFLSGSQSEDYAPQSGEILGILKTIKDEMASALADAEAAEKKAAAQYESIMAAKEKEIAALTKKIEAKLEAIAELGVVLAKMEIDLQDVKESLSDDEKFLVELSKGCGGKTKEWEEIKKNRGDELVALAETIKVLNDDDALELFKKTLPSAGASFLQVTARASEMRARALAMLRAGMKSRSLSGGLTAHPQLDLIALALSGKRQGFEKVIGMIDDMVGILKKEQVDDDNKQEYCEKQFDATEDKQKGLENAIADSEAAIENVKGAIANLADDIEALEAGIQSLDKSVAEATDLRKQEHADYTALIAADSTAKEVLLWAKNRLNKFYNPKLYKAPAARELTDTQAVTVGMGGTLAPTPAPGGIAGTGIGAASFAQVAPPPPPETFGAYTKKGEENAGVTQMIDLLVKDLDNEVQESEVMEKDAQHEYEQMLADAKTKRADDARALADKASAKAAQEEALQAESGKKDGVSDELVGTLKYISSLHGECDWLLKFFDVRKSARTEEIEALGRAKAVLSGADFALLQTSHKSSKTQRFLGF